MREWKIVAVVILAILTVLAIAIHSTMNQRRFLSSKGRRLTDKSGSLSSSQGQSLLPLGNLAFQRTSERFERGRYLVEGLAHCFHCHSELDSRSAGAPPVAAKKGGGKVVLVQGPIRLVAANITPDLETGVGAWSDGQLARAIREGISHDGRVLAGMPTEEYSILSDEDVASIVVYLRSIKPVRNALPKTHLPPEVQKSLQPVSITAPVPPPDFSNPFKRGAYYVSVGRCAGCHTPRDKNGQEIGGLEFGGGGVFEGNVASTNITPDPSGISHYDDVMFVRTMRTGRVGGIRRLSPIMPWVYFRTMSDEDLKAIFAYLRRLKPARHRIDNAEPPTYCRRCGGRHGLGQLN